MKKLLTISVLLSIYTCISAQKTNAVPEDFGCCPGKNLICNGGFEDGQKCVESEYPFSNGQPFKPGSYTITDYGKASQFCKNWSFNNAPCQRSGKAMFVNGATNGQGSKIIWQQKVSFNGLKQYRFCADVFVLNQCCLNVIPKIKMTLTYTSGGQPKTISLNQVTTDACNWSKYTKGLAQWEASDNNTATITISLDETGIGDGNDFVLDNISFREIFPIAKTITNSVTLTVGEPTGPNNSYGITGNFTGALPGGIGFQWIVMEVNTTTNPPSIVCDINTNPLSWQTPTTTFPGLKNCQVAGTAPGVFEPGKTYKIAFGTFGFCNAWDAVIFTVRVDPATRKATITKDDKVVVETEPVFKKLKVKELDPDLLLRTN
jgi:hypothetical protein